MTCAFNSFASNVLCRLALKPCGLDGAGRDLRAIADYPPLSGARGGCFAILLEASSERRKRLIALLVAGGVSGQGPARDFNSRGWRSLLGEGQMDSP
jgi:hypothetical protein